MQTNESGSENELQRLAHPATNAWLAVVKAYNICTRSILARIAPTGLSVLQHEILINLLLKPGQSQQELALKCFSAKSGVSALLSAFEMDGMIVRKPDKDDGRQKLLFLTETGLKQAEINFNIQNEIVGTMASVFSPESLDELETGMVQASDVLKKTYL